MPEPQESQNFFDLEPIFSPLAYSSLDVVLILCYHSNVAS